MKDRSRGIIGERVTGIGAPHGCGEAGEAGLRVVAGWRLSQALRSLVDTGARLHGKTARKLRQMRRTSAHEVENLAICHRGNHWRGSERGERCAIAGSAT